MEFKKLLTILTLTVIILVACVLGGSLAWYNLSNSGTTYNATTSSANDLKITYDQGQYINTTTGAPIAAADVATLASKNNFSVTRGTALNGYKVSIEIALTDISMSSDLQVDSFKYQLYADNVPVNSTPGTGVDFKTTASGGKVADNKLIIKPLGEISSGTTNYQLRVWLQDNNGNQNSLQGKNFNAKIQITSSIKK